ncbi:restriction endonuclease [Candidatus Babeliales bacterium]|nr:restriction endonuclease [Candidatus Babeliales bacterium]
MSKNITVIKASGDKEPFSEKKYKSALKRAGASEKVIKEALEKVKKIRKTEVTAKELYRETFKVLKKKERGTAGRYNLKNALFQLGPSGYPFEHFVGDIFQELGYSVEVGKNVQGKCVQHEVDVIAINGNKHALIECKFHNSPGLYTSVKVPLYVKARFDDLNEYADKHKKKSEHFHEGYVFTNTRFSRDSMAYAKCRGLNLVGWSYPEGKGIANLIDTLGIHPITCLAVITKKEAKKLIEQGIVTCRDIANKLKTLKAIGFKQKKIDQIVEEAKSICKKNKR